MALRGSADRTGLRARRLRVLHRGDLPRPVSLRLGAPAAAAALVVRRRGRASAAPSPRSWCSPSTRGCSTRSASRSSPTGAPVDVDAWAVFANPAWAPMAAHSTLSCYQAVGFAAAANYAWTLWRQPAADRYARLGADDRDGGRHDRRDRAAAHRRPARQARAPPAAGQAGGAGGARSQTQRRAPLTIGGWPDAERRETRYGIEIPGAAQLPRRQRASTPRCSDWTGSRATSGPTSPWPTSPSRSWSARAWRCSAPRCGTGCAWWRARGRRRAAPAMAARRARPLRRRSASSRSKPAGSSPRSAASRG